MSIPVEKIYEGNKRYIEACGESTDTKPTENILAGSIFVEIDTGDVYFYSETQTDWVKQFSFQG